MCRSRQITKFYMKRLTVICCFLQCPFSFSSKLSKNIASFFMDVFSKKLTNFEIRSSYILPFLKSYSNYNSTSFGSRNVRPKRLSKPFSYVRLFICVIDYKAYCLNFSSPIKKFKKKRYITILCYE